MKLKLNEQGFAEVKDGHPVYLMADGSEVPYDVPKLHQSLGALRDEAKNHRLGKEDYEAKYKPFEGMDPETVKKALQFAQSMEGKKAMDDESIKSLIANAVKPLQEQIAEREQALAAKDGHIYRLEVGNRFATSSYLKDKTILTPDAAEALFGKHFKVEGEKMYAVDAAGNQIYSRKNPVEPAEFDEAISILFESYPHRDTYARGTGASGAGTKGGQGMGGSGIRSRADFKTDSDKAKFIGEHGLDAFKSLPPE